MSLARSASFALAALASLGAVSAATTPAFAADDVNVRVVEYGDLDLNSRRGVERLNNRLDSAIDSVCNTRQARDLTAIRVAQECKAAAKSRAQLAANRAIERETRLAGATQTPAG